MAPKIRTIIRDLEGLSSKGEFNQLIALTISTIKEYDKKREYNKSIKILEKSHQLLRGQTNEVTLGDILAHLQIRYLLVGEIENAKEIQDNKGWKTITPLLELSNSLVSTYVENAKAEYQIQSVEKMSMFGSYNTLPDLPVLYFDDEQDAVQVLEDMFPNGRYIINLIQTENMLHHSIKVDVGVSEDVNVVEIRREFRIK